uniref:Uncharacterized protein n=1 Tax=Cucumis melo TaxID=3656 RepID=A0A9I9DSP6_CUCME
MEMQRRRPRRRSVPTRVEYVVMRRVASAGQSFWVLRDLDEEGNVIEPEQEEENQTDAGFQEEGNQEAVAVEVEEENQLEQEVEVEENQTEEVEFQQEIQEEENQEGDAENQQGGVVQVVVEARFQPVENQLDNVTQQFVEGAAAP